MRFAAYKLNTYAGALFMQSNYEVLWRRMIHELHFLAIKGFIPEPGLDPAYPEVSKMPLRVFLPTNMVWSW